MRISDWSSDVCSSDLERIGRTHARLGLEPGRYIDGYAVVTTHLHALVLDLFQSRWSPAAARRRCTMLIQAIDKLVFTRSEERRVGQEWVRSGRSRWSPYP